MLGADVLFLAGMAISAEMEDLTVEARDHRSP